MDDIKRPRRRPPSVQTAQKSPYGMGGGFGVSVSSRRTAISTQKLPIVRPSGTGPQLTLHQKTPTAPTKLAGAQQPTAKLDAKRPEPVVQHVNKKRDDKPKNKSTSPRLFVILVAISVVLGVGAWAFISLYWLGMKTTSYDNNKGSQYQLTYYTRHSLNDGKSSGSYATLVSGVSRSGKAPLSVYINQLPNKPNNSAIYCYTSADAKISVKNNYSNQDIQICPAGHLNDPTMYTAVFESGGKWHQLVANQNITTTNEDGRDPADIVSKKTGVAPYKNDIKSIVASVKYIR